MHSVPPVVADKLEALVGDVLGYRRYEVAGGEHLEALRQAQGPERSRGIALYLRVLAGSADNGPAAFFDLHLFHGEGVADDVLGEPFEVFALMGLDAVAAVYVEAGVDPAAQHPGAFGWEESLFDQTSTDFMAEFGVSRRTVARDLDFLRDEERAPLAYDDARHGFRLTDETYTLPPVSISRREAFNFALARKLLAHYEGTPLHLDMQGGAGVGPQVSLEHQRLTTPKRHYLGPISANENGLRVAGNMIVPRSR